MLLEIFLFVSLFCLLAFLDTRKPKKFPPGPKWLPIIGSTLVIQKYKKQHKYLFKATSEMSKKYGPIIGLRCGKDLIVVVIGAQEIKEFLSSDDLSGRPKGPFYATRTWGRRRGVMLTDAEFWKEQRRFVLRHLREFGFGRQNMSSMIEEEAETMVGNIRRAISANGGAAVVDITGFFNVHVVNTLWTMIAGVRYGAEDVTLRKLQKILAELLDNSHMMGVLFNHYPVLKFLAPEFSGYNLYVNVHKPLWAFLREELHKHKDSYNPHIQRDFMDVYLQMLESPDKPESFSEEQLVAICLDFFVAGSETTSKSLSFGFLYFLLFPDVQRKVQEEIDRVVGRDRVLTLDDRPKMPYLEATVLESIRMFMARAHGIPHRALRDTVLNGYIIPKDTTILANYYLSLMGPEFPHHDPEAFRPDRFLMDGRLYPAAVEQFLPFGFGKRRCMGETMARANLFLFIGTLLQHFDYSVVKDCPPEIRIIDGVTPGLEPIQAEIRLRELVE